LIKLGISQQDIDELKEAVLSPEEETYIQKLKEWKELEDNLKEEAVIVKNKLVDIGDSLVRIENKVIKSATEDVKSFEIDKLAKFVFRGKVKELSAKFLDDTEKWFLDKFEKWLDDEKSRVMIVNGGPGVRKSVLSAKICELYNDGGKLAACHFWDFKTSDYRDPHKILQSLASQMCDNIVGFYDELHKVLCRKHSTDSVSDAFRVYLNDPLHSLDRCKPMVIVLDALDESETDEKNEFLELIAGKFYELPNWIKIFITSRPELQMKKKLEHLNPRGKIEALVVEGEDMDIDETNEGNTPLKKR
jgi:hypothetical protein